jgi:hypothetical protein
MLSRRSSVPFSAAAKQDANQICFASSTFYTSSKTHGKSAQTKSTTVGRSTRAGDIGVRHIKSFSATFSAPRFVDCQLRVRMDKMKGTTKSQKMDEAFSVKQDDGGHLALLRR